MLPSDCTLMAMAAKGRGSRFDSVRIQKLLFLIDREATAHVGGPHFNFQPYLYGPFDKAVYQEIEALHDAGAIDSHNQGGQRAYALTPSGYERGVAVLNELAEPVRRYVAEAARWVLSLPFGKLLAAIYHYYPDMAINSIVPEVIARYPRMPYRPPRLSLVSGIGRTLDLAGVLDQQAQSGSSRQDAWAIHADWCAVGDDLRNAVAGCELSDRPDA